MRNLILNEDCLVTMANMANKSVDMVFTSPPYNRKRNDKYTHFDDVNSDYFAFLVKVIDECIRVCRGNVFINIQKNYYNKADVFKLFGHYADILTEVFIWEKTNPMPAAGLSITNSYEYILCLGPTVKSNRTYTKNILSTSVNRMTKEHKAIMHPAVSDFFIENFSKENDLIYDPFIGTGTTAISAKKYKRNYLGSEICKEYYNVCIKNLIE